MIPWVDSSFIIYDDPLDAMYQFNARVYVWKLKRDCEYQYGEFLKKEKKYIAERKFAKYAYIYRQMQDIVFRAKLRINYHVSHEYIYNYVYQSALDKNVVMQLFKIPDRLYEIFHDELLKGIPIDTDFVINIYEKFSIPYSKTWIYVLH